MTLKLYLNLADTKSNMKKPLILFYAMSLVGGVLLAKSSWDRLSFVYVGSERSPAALRGMKDFSSLRGSSLNEAAANELIDQIKLLPMDGGIRLELNQFILRDQQGHKNFVCRIGGRDGVFDRLEVTLMGYGVSEHGESPEMIVTSDCVSSDDGKSVGSIAISIPMREVANLKPVDQSLALGDSLMTTVRLVNMTSVWPEEWQVLSVRYFKLANDNQDLTLRPNRKGSPKEAYSFLWPETRTN